MSNLPNPYVGPRSYEAHETLYGRDREIRQLLALLVAERIVLLHSPSGAGKTSLLMAGLLPRMRADDFHVLPVVRVNLDVPNRLAGRAANRYLLSTLLSLEEEVPEANRLALSDLPGLSLDAYLHCRHRPENASPSELLVFDQFEEVLTVSPSDRDGKLAFFEQLGSALRNRNRWAIFAMRDDYVAALAPYLRPMPNRLSTAFRLDLLGREAALQAIQKPAKTAQVDFSTAAAEKLVDDLSQVQEQAPDGHIELRSGLYVEPVQLQVVCYRLWDSQVMDDHVITVEDLGQVGSVDDSLAGYYTQSVERVAARARVEERAIREWFGSRLITPEGVRSQVLQRVDASDGLDNRAIFALVDTHILRAEKRAGATWFELAHDRLIAPVRKSNAAWFKTNLRVFQVQAGLWEQNGRGEGMLLRGKALLDAEQEAKATVLTPLEKDFMAACAKARDQEIREKKRTRTLRILAIAATIAMVVSVILGIVALITAGNLEVEKTNAIIAENKALEAKSTAEAERVRADNQAKIALSRQLAIQSQSFPNNLGEDYTRKGLLAVEAARLYPAVDSNQSLIAFLNIQGKINWHISQKMPADDAFDVYIRSVKFSPDGRYVASGSRNGVLRVSDAVTGSQVWQIQKGEDTSFVAFSPDSRFVAAGIDNTVWVLETATGKELGSKQHAGDYINLAFSPDSRYVASASYGEPTVYVWDAVTGDEKFSIQQESRISWIGFSPDGLWLVTTCENGVTSIWDAATGLLDTILAQDNEGSFQNVMSKDGRYIVTGGPDYAVRVWDLPARTVVAQMKHPVSAGTCMDNQGVMAAAISQDNKYIVTGSLDCTARVWDVSSGQEVSRMTHDSDVNQLGFSPDGKYVISGSFDGMARVWEASSGNEVSRMSLKNDVTALDFSPDGRTVVTGTREATLWAWDAFAKPDVERKRKTVYSADLAFSPDGRWMVMDNQVWDLASNQFLLQAQVDFGSTSAAFSPNSQLVVSGGSHLMVDNRFGVWEAATGKQLAQFTHGMNAYSFSFSPDSNRVISAGDDNTVKVWDIASGTEVLNLQHTKPVLSAAFTPDGKWIVSIGQETIWVWDAVSGSEVRQMQHDGNVSSIAISPDSQFIVSGSEDRTARVWELTAGQELARMQHNGAVSSVAFNPDGTQVVSGSEDGTVMLWEAATQTQIWQKHHDEKVNSVAFSLDGMWVASGSAGGPARVWEAASGVEVASVQNMGSVNFSPDNRWLASKDSYLMQKFRTAELAEIACSHLTRNLTQSEWQQYIGDVFPYEQTCPNLPIGGE